MTADSPAIRDTAHEARRTPLHDLLGRRGARFTDFAGWLLPLQFEQGVLHEARRTREAAGIFDVSHMGQWLVSGPDADALVRRLLPVDTGTLSIGRTRYTVMLNEAGGVVDDLLVSREADDAFWFVVNAARREADRSHVSTLAESMDVVIEEQSGWALIALQGPEAESTLRSVLDFPKQMRFMDVRWAQSDAGPVRVSRTGYTGEDGFELSAPAPVGEALAGRLLERAEVEPAGLAARDALRLEAGLCLWGHELDESTTPWQAGVGFAMSPARLREGGFVGAEVVAAEGARDVDRLRVGLRPSGRAPVREGAAIMDQAGRRIGEVTSGGFGPTVDAPIAMGYVEAAFAEAGRELAIDRRGKSMPAVVAPLPFAAHRYRRD